jgi:hypothetical protein
MTTKILSVKLNGIRKTIEKIDGFKRISESAMKQALTTTALFVKRESMKRTPVLTGALKNSHTVTKAESDGKKASIKIKVGGSSLTNESIKNKVNVTVNVNYALFVHEDLTARHTNGQAKFLYNAVMENDIPAVLVRNYKRIASKRTSIGKGL